MLKLFSIEKVIIAALLAALSYWLLMFANLSDDLESAKDLVDSKNQTIENLSIQSEYLAKSIELTEKQNIKLMRERNSLTRINKTHQLKVLELSNSLDLMQSETQSLRESINEAVKQWANDSVPCDAVSLLKYARARHCYQNSGTN